jgi:hypothetical protein
MAAASLVWFNPRLANSPRMRFDCSRLNTRAFFISAYVPLCYYFST